MLNSIEELEGLVNDIMLETQRYLRSPYLSFHEKDHVRDAIGRGISACEATMAIVATMATTSSNTVERNGQRLELIMRNDTEETVRRALIHEAAREIEAMQFELDVMRGAHAFTDELQRALARLFRRATLLLRKPVRDFPAPILE